MLSKQNKHKHHKQPQFYLRGFATKCGCPDTPLEFVYRNESIWVYKKGEPFSEKNPKCKGIGNAAFTKNFYAFEEEDGFINFNKYENLLMNNYEQPAKSVIEKIRRFEDIDREEKEKLFNYVASMVMRGDSWKKIGEYAERVNEPIAKAEIEKDASLIVRIAQMQDDEKYKDVDKVSKILTDYIEDERKKRKKGEYEKLLMVRFTEKLRDEILKDLNFRFFISPKDTSFFTSDNPVCYDPFDHPNAQLFFPISSNVCLNLYKQKYLNNIKWLRKSNQFWQIDNKTLEGIRDFMARKAVNEIYHSQRAEWLVKFINNRKNS